MLPNQQPIRFIAATLNPIDVGVGAGTSGKRSAANAETAMIEFNVVKGICPRPAATPSFKNERKGGTKACGRPMPSDEDHEVALEER